MTTEQTRSDAIEMVRRLLLDGHRIDRMLYRHEDGHYWTTDAEHDEPRLRVQWLDAGTPDRDETAEAEAEAIIDNWDELCVRD